MAKAGKVGRHAGFVPAARAAYTMFAVGHRDSTAPRTPAYPHGASLLSLHARGRLARSPVAHDAAGRACERAERATPPRRSPTTPQWQALPKNNNRADQGGLRGNPAPLPPSPSHEQTAAYNRHGTARDGPPRAGRKREGKV